MYMYIIYIYPDVSVLFMKKSLNSRRRMHTCQNSLNLLCLYMCVHVISLIPIRFSVAIANNWYQSFKMCNRVVVILGLGILGIESLPSGGSRWCVLWVEQHCKYLEHMDSNSHHENTRG